MVRAWCCWVPEIWLHRVQPGKVSQSFCPGVSLYLCNCIKVIRIVVVCGVRTFFGLPAAPNFVSHAWLSLQWHHATLSSASKVIEVIEACIVLNDGFIFLLMCFALHMSLSHVFSIDVKSVQRVRTNSFMDSTILELFAFFKLRHISHGVTLQARGLRYLARSQEAEIGLYGWLGTTSASLMHCILVVALMKVDYLVHPAH